MDNKAYEQYKSQQPQVSNYELRKLNDESETKEWNLSTAEISVVVLMAILVAYALFKLFRKDKD
jgi:translation elongation factor P/translation initiation factor 5A